MTMERTITGKTALFGIIGYPIRHSLSPVIQNSAFAAAGIDAVYVPFEVLPGALEHAVSGLIALGVQGFNVTIPHKTSIIPLLHRLDKSAELAGAVNTVKRENDQLVGYNTDGYGLVRSLEQDCSFDPSGKNVLIYGAGGAARGAVAALCQTSVKNISIVNRTEKTTIELISFFASRYPETEFSMISSVDDYNATISRIDLLLNTTSLGMKHEKLPLLSFDKLQRSAVVYDMVYSQSKTPLLQDANHFSHRCANGLGMLVCQGELAFERWTGMLPEPNVMRNALERFATSNNA